MIDAKTKLFAVIGKPIEHSLSPQMHNAAFAENKINAAMLAFTVEDLEGAVRAFRALGMGGMSVTIPHKVKIMDYLDVVEESAKKVGAVNCVVNEGGKLVGYNTDVYGALSAVSDKIGLNGKTVMLVGAGGAGRAIAVAFKDIGCELLIADRSAEKASELAGLVGAKAVEVGEISSQKYDVLANATPVGMSPNTEEMPVGEDALNCEAVFDAIYTPQETMLLKKAKEKGCETIGGLEMLLKQGAKAFELWTGQNAPEDAMAYALKKGLEALK